MLENIGFFHLQHHNHLGLNFKKEICKRRKNITKQNQKKTELKKWK